MTGHLLGGLLDGAPALLPTQPWAAQVGNNTFFHGRQVVPLQHQVRGGRPRGERLFWNGEEMCFQRDRPPGAVNVPGPHTITGLAAAGTLRHG